MGQQPPFNITCCIIKIWFIHVRKGGDGILDFRRQAENKMAFYVKQNTHPADYSLELA